MYGFFRAIVSVIIKLFFPTKFIGRENLIDSGCIIVCNHYSAWDIPIAMVAIPYKMIVLGKQEVVNLKILGRLFKHLGAIPVDRNNVQPSSIKEVIKRLKGGNKLLLYPEGTRKKAAGVTLTALKNGASLFALSTKVPVIPMMLEKKPRIFRKNRIFIGKPIYFEGLKANKEDIAISSEMIKSKMEELKTNFGLDKINNKS